MITMWGGQKTLMMVSSGERWIGSMPPGLSSPSPLITAAGSATARATTSRTLSDARSPLSAALQSATNWSLSNMARSPLQLPMWPSMQAPYVRRALAGKVAHAILHDEGEAPVVLQDADVGQRIAVDQQQVGEIARLHPTELIGPPHRLATGAGRRLQHLARAEAEMLHEELEVARVAALRVGREAVVAADQDADAALAHLDMDAAARLVDRLQPVGHDPAGRRVVAAHRLEPVDDQGEGWTGEDAVLGAFQKIERLGVGEVAVIDDIDTVPHRALHGGRGAGMRGDPAADRVRGLDAGRDLGLGHDRDVR